MITIPSQIVRQVLEELSHPFIVALHETYSLHNRVYFLLGIALGGDMYR